MANYMLVDVDKLESDLKTVADSIRAKSGTTAELEWPNGYKSTVDGIVLNNVTIEEKNGNLTVSNGSASVSCGFKPDLVIVTNNVNYQGYSASAGFAFAATGKKTLESAIWGSSSNFVMISVQCTQNSDGFSVKATQYDDNAVSYSGNLSYIAVKYTK